MVYMKTLYLGYFLVDEPVWSWSLTCCVFGGWRIRASDLISVLRRTGMAVIGKENGCGERLRRGRLWYYYGFFRRLRCRCGFVAENSSACLCSCMTCVPPYFFVIGFCLPDILFFHLFFVSGLIVVVTIASRNLILPCLSDIVFCCH